MIIGINEKMWQFISMWLGNILHFNVASALVWYLFAMDTMSKDGESLDGSMLALDRTIDQPMEEEAGSSNHAYIKKVQYNTFCLLFF